MKNETFKAVNFVAFGNNTRIYTKDIQCISFNSYYPYGDKKNEKKNVFSVWFNNREKERQFEVSEQEYERLQKIFIF